MEIERKFKLKEIPDNLEKYEMKEIEQGYLCINPVVRIRKSNETFILTYKSKIGLGEETGKEAKVCNEVEVPLNKEGYEHLKKKIDGCLIKKKRYLVPVGGRLVAEVDMFLGIYEGLVIAEVEFQSEEQAGRFVPPEWFGEEVTFDKRYLNKNMAMVASLEKMQYNSSQT